MQVFQAETTQKFTTLHLCKFSTVWETPLDSVAEKKNGKILFFFAIIFYYYCSNRPFEKREKRPFYSDVFTFFLLSKIQKDVCKNMKKTLKFF